MTTIEMSLLKSNFKFKLAGSGGIQQHVFSIRRPGTWREQARSSSLCSVREVLRKCSKTGLTELAFNQIFAGLGESFRRDIPSNSKACCGTTSEPPAVF